MNIFPDPLPPEDRLRIGIISRLYHVLLGRTADVGGLTALVQRLRDGIPLDTIMAEALLSDEFLARHGMHAQSTDDVDALYRAAYQAPPPEVDRTLSPGAYAAQVLTAAETRSPSRTSDIMFADGLDPTEGFDYRVWLADFHTPDPAELAAAAPPGSGSVAVSLVLCGGWTREAALAATLESIRAQICDQFELVIVGRGPFRAKAARLAEQGSTAAAQPARVVPPLTLVGCSDTRPAALLNTALPRCRGRFILPLHAGARLSPDAVWHVAQAGEDANAAALLLDYDGIDSAGVRQLPTLHCGWDPEVALCRLDWAAGIALNTELTKAAGGADPGAGLAAYADLALRVVERAGHDRVKPIQRPLLHLPLPRSGRFSLPTRLRQWREARSWLRIVQARLGDGDSAAQLTRVKQGGPRHEAPNRVTPWRIAYPVPREQPLVSLIIPTRDKVDLLRRCVDGLLTRTGYAALEILLLDNRSSEPETLTYLRQIEQQPRVRVLGYDADFNWGAINNFGVRNARGEIVVLLNNDTDVLEPDWLDEMVAQALRPEIGAVGAKLLYHDHTVQHAGLVLGPDGHSFHRFRHVPDNISGYRNELAMVRSVSAVTGACLAMRRAVFDEVGGIEETGLVVTWSDVDLCYRVREAGYRVICTPYARLLHLELATRGADDTPERVKRAEDERQFMMKKWASLANEDPFFNLNLRLAKGETRLAAPPRLMAGRASGR